MGFFSKLFGAATNCNRCGNPKAKDSFAGIKCPTPGCPNYAGAGLTGQASSSASAVADTRNASFAEPVELTYLNHRNESRRIIGDRRSIKDRGNFISLVAAPKGIRISLRKDKISGVTPADLAAAIDESTNGPSARESYILRYHKKRGSSSPKYEELRRQFPNFLG